MTHHIRPDVRPARRTDVGVVAGLHARCIGEGFLATLGPRFLDRLYRRMVASPTACVLVASDGTGAVVGFVAVATDTGRFYREFLRRDALPAALAAAPSLLRSPRRVWETLRYGTAGADDLPPAEILAVAVAPEAVGNGIGGALVRAALDELHGLGVDTARVVTAAGNERALGMYLGAGFRRVRGTELHRGVAQEALVWP